MAAAVAVIASFAGAASAVSAAGGVLAAMSTIGGFLSVAGAALTGIGAITGKKDLLKVGGLMSLGGAIGSAANAANAASQGAASAAPAAAEAASPTGIFQSQFQPVQALANAGAAEPVAGLGQSLLQQAMTNPGAIEPVASLGVQDAIAQAGRGMTSSEMQSLLSSAFDRTKSALGGVGQFVQKNPMLTMIGGQMLSSAYGPEAEAIDLEKSIMRRRLRNINNPIRLGQITPGAQG